MTVVTVCDHCRQPISFPSGFKLDRIDTFTLTFADEVGPWHFCSMTCLAGWLAASWVRFDYGAVKDTP